MKNSLKIILASLVICLLSAFTWQQVKQGILVSAEKFTEQANAEGLNFVIPEGFQPTEVFESLTIPYEFAMVSDSGDLEVRYAIYSLVEPIRQFNQCWEELDTACEMSNPNEFFIYLGDKHVLEMANGPKTTIKPFGREAVKKEFNADFGGTAFIIFDCEFAGDYPFGQIVILHKNNVADVVITYLFHDNTRAGELLKTPFHALTYK